MSLLLGQMILDQWDQQLLRALATWSSTTGSAPAYDAYAFFGPIQRSLASSTTAVFAPTPTAADGYPTISSYVFGSVFGTGGSKTGLQTSPTGENAGPESTIGSGSGETTDFATTSTGRSMKSIGSTAGNTTTGYGYGLSISSIAYSSIPSNISSSTISSKGKDIACWDRGKAIS
jgi:hypothetical protein